MPYLSTLLGEKSFSRLLITLVDISVSSSMRISILDMSFDRLVLPYLIVIASFEEPLLREASAVLINSLASLDWPVLK